MCIYMYVYVFVCLCTCVYVCMYKCVHMCMYMFVCLCTCVFVCVCVCVRQYSSCCYWNYYRFRVQTPFKKKKLFGVFFLFSSVVVTDEDHLIFCVVDCPNLQCYSDIEALEHHLLHTTVEDKIKCRFCYRSTVVQRRFRIS